MSNVLSSSDLDLVDAYWRASTYLTTTTPFDMVVRNGMSRYHLCIEALRRGGGALPRSRALIDECNAALERNHVYTREHLEDMPEIRDWVWSAP